MLLGNTYEGVASPMSWPCLPDTWEPGLVVRVTAMGKPKEVHTLPALKGRLPLKQRREP